MSETDTEIIKIPDNQPSTHTRLPIVMQLGVLALILSGIFSSLYFQQSPEKLSQQETFNEKPIVEAAVVIPAVPQKINSVNITARAAYVWDVAQQRALYAKDAEESLALASITKLMTTLLAHELLEGNQATTVSTAAVNQDGDSGLAAGEMLEIKDLERLALISSSNDAAFVLAASVGQLLGDQNPERQFVTAMNIRADELELLSLDFKNTTGLDLSKTVPGATGSAKDISFLMEYIITKYPELLSPTTETSARIYNSDGEYHDAVNTNVALNRIPNLIASKTGYTDIAGGNLTVAFDLGLNRPIIITVLGSTYNERFSDVLKLVDAVQDSVSATE